MLIVSTWNTYGIRMRRDLCFIEKECLILGSVPLLSICTSLHAFSSFFPMPLVFLLALFNDILLLLFNFDICMNLISKLLIILYNWDVSAYACIFGAFWFTQVFEPFLSKYGLSPGSTTQWKMKARGPKNGPCHAAPQGPSRAAWAEARSRLVSAHRAPRMLKG